MIHHVNWLGVGRGLPICVQMVSSRVTHCLTQFAWVTSPTHGRGAWGSLKISEPRSKYPYIPPPSPLCDFVQAFSQDNLDDAWTTSITMGICSEIVLHLLYRDSRNPLDPAGFLLHTCRLLLGALGIRTKICISAPASASREPANTPGYPEMPPCGGFESSNDLGIPCCSDRCATSQTELSFRYKPSTMVGGIMEHSRLYVNPRGNESKQYSIYSQC